MLHVLAGVFGAGLIALMLVEFFLTYLLPRRVKRDPRVARQLYRLAWKPWRALAGRLPGPTADTMLGIFGPLGLVGVLGVWVVGLILGFAALYWSTRATLLPGVAHDFCDDLTYSGATFFSTSSGLGLRGGNGRVLSIVEAASGFGVFFIAIGYLPSLYQSFSRREVAVSQLDPMAGSPPTAQALLLSPAGRGGWNELEDYLKEWEGWAAELMETHLSYPILAYFRSQHVNQNWLAALTTVLDTCAMAISARPSAETHPAHLAFAIGRHALSDIALINGAPATPPESDRLPPEDFALLCRRLEEAGMPVEEDHDVVRARLDHRRATYEPRAVALSRTLALALPAWLPEE